MEQEDAQFAFEQPHLAAQRGLGQMQPVGRPGEVPLLGHGHHVAELV